MEHDKRWEKIERIFNQAVLVPVHERIGFIEQNCDDTDLRIELISLLNADEQSSEILEQSVFPMVAQLLDDDFSQLLEKSEFASYKLQILLGRGGMGAVFLAVDTRLGRSVALKILPPTIAENSEIVLRFRQEAKAASAISHPNIAHIYEFGIYEGMYFLAMEYVPGKTLRDLLKEKQIDLRGALDIAIQVADALKAAHQEHITHRDIKPENIILTKDGLVKVLDFGLAKLGVERRVSETSSLETTPGTIIGTTAYMSPEQIRGNQIDERTDLWSLGILIYELVTGERPFTGNTRSDIQAAILLQEPLLLPFSEELPDLNRIVHKALAKDVAARYQSAKEIIPELRSFQRQVYDFLQLNDEQKPLVSSVKPKLVTGSQHNTITNDKRFNNGRVSVQSLSAPKIKQLTFRQGVIQSAKFSYDNQTIVYDAAWGGAEPELYSIHRDAWDSQPMGLKQINVFAISPTGEMAVALRRKFLRGYVSVATLARIHQRGGTPRELLENVQWADWYPDKERLAKLFDNQCLAIVREVEGRSRLEYPIGNVLYETGGWISYPRFSPSGEAIAFIDHPTLADDSGAVAVIDLQGKDKFEKRVLSDGWISIRGLAWNGAAGEIWFTATREGNARALYAVASNSEIIDGTSNERLVYKGFGSLTLHDLCPDGTTALITVDKTRIRILSGNCSEEREECDLSWHDWSLVRDLSPDGETILFTEAGESGGSLYSVYVRKTDSSPALRLGNGSALSLSPDRKFALVSLLTMPRQLALLPTGAGETKMLQPYEPKSLKYQPWACWFPDGKKILFAANESDKGTKLYVQELDGEPVCLTAEQEGMEISSPHSISPDGKQVAIINSEKRICLYGIEDSKRELLPDLTADYLVVGWSGDGSYLFIRERGQVPAIVYRYELATAKTEEWLRLMPQDKTGVHEILRVLLTPDGKSYAYSYVRDLSDLFLIEGLQ
ncbi:MAG: protein kinase [Acidobacteria bacterium]|nr:protein kinase [Acidobacteriota bacterium]MCA1637402.1 protein kinase [Acidobacteriota bacterium]